MKQTNFKKLGVQYPIQSEMVKEKIKQTCLKKYGTENPMQNAIVFEKNSKSLYRTKTFIFPSGNTIKCQGYEPFGLKYLIEIEKINENDIMTGSKNVPTIWYFNNENKKHRHYVDIFIPSQNRCIEIKSIWTFKNIKSKEYIFEKQKAGKELGYQYEIWVYDYKGERTSFYI
jgi:hypothetical protein